MTTTDDRGTHQARRGDYRGLHYAQRPRRLRREVGVGVSALGLIAAATAFALGGGETAPPPAAPVAAEAGGGQTAPPPAAPVGAEATAEVGAEATGGAGAEATGGAGAEAAPVPADSAPEQSVPASAPPVPATAPPAEPADPPRALPPLVESILTPPAEFQRRSDATAGTGPLDVAGAASSDGRGGLSQGELVELGLLDTHSHHWRSPTGVLHVTGYEFGDERAAEQFVARAGAPARVRVGAVPLAIDQPPGVRAYRMQVAGDPLQVALFADGRRAYAVGLRGPVAADATGARLRDLAVAQADG